MLKALAVAETLSLKVMSTLLLTETFVALLTGEVAVTVGALSPGTPLAVSEKSSMPRPSSAPVASTSVQRIQKLAPFAILNPGIVELRAMRFAGALPSSAPTVGPVIGGLKSSALTSIQVPVVRLVALVLYWKSIRSAIERPVAPRRH